MISVLASSMTGFGLTIWMYDQTKSASAMALTSVFFLIPMLILSPVAGVMVDRYNRKLMMISDLTAGLGTIMILTLFWLGRLEFWHIYLAMVLMGTGNAFQ